MNNRITRNHTLEKRFGVTEEGFIDLPTKISNVRVARIFAEAHGECGFCFPHGIEKSNATVKKNTRSWKFHRRNQFREHRGKSDMDRSHPPTPISIRPVDKYSTGMMMEVYNHGCTGGSSG